MKKRDSYTSFYYGMNVFKDRLILYARELFHIVVMKHYERRSTWKQFFPLSLS